HGGWAWAHGAVQYRDVFDNHAPLFHLAMAPMMAALGERADIVAIGRAAMVPLLLASLAATFALGRALWSAEVGCWAAVAAGALPGFLPTSVECRADLLWTAAGLAGLAVLLGGPATPRRWLLAGVLLGVALATSLKT